MASPLGGLPRPPFFLGQALASFTVPWAGWFSTIQAILFAQSQSGTTAQRPVPTYVGQRYFDTTLGLPVWAKTTGGSAVWVNGAGTPV